MGLFDKLGKEGANLLKEGEKVLKEVASDENKEKAAELFQSLKETISEKAEDLSQAVDEWKAEQQARTEEPQQQASYYEADASDSRSCREKILACLSEEFSNYTVEENVSPRRFGGEGRFMDYSIAVFDGTEVRLVIMLIGKTTTQHREYRWSKELAEKNGYPFINFINHYPNTPEYISDRLHKYL